MLARAILAICMAITFGISFAKAQDKKPAKGSKYESKEAKIGYFLGLSVGQRLAGDGIADGDFDIDSLIAGIDDAMDGKKSALSDEELQETQGILSALVFNRQKEDEAKRKEKAADNKKRSDQWLVDNAKKKGIKKLDVKVEVRAQMGGKVAVDKEAAEIVISNEENSRVIKYPIREGADDIVKNGLDIEAGKLLYHFPLPLQYKVMKEGDGPSPSISDRVRVHYVGKLIDGTVFDSSVERGEPATFLIKQVIQGWQETIPKMKVGDKWTLYIPSELGYGERGVPGPPGSKPTIGANEALIFEVELLEIL